MHFKVGSAIILTCIVHQPSVKDIGPIYWYRGEYMITPFDINDQEEESADVALKAGLPTTKHPIYLPLATTATTRAAAVAAVVTTRASGRLLTKDIDLDLGIADAYGENEYLTSMVTNEITQDFAQRIAMESQLGDTMRSR